MPTSNTINLTMPIQPYLPVGAVHAWESPCWTESISRLAYNGAELFFISMGTGTGTRLRTTGFAAEDGAKILDVPLPDLANRPTIVVTIPKGAGEQITEADIERAFAEVEWADEAVLLRTGWGDADRWLELGERFALDTPTLTADAATRLAKIMADHGSTLLLTDCAHLDAADSFARSEWAELKPWLRPSWPSEQAKAYVRHYTPEKAAADWVSTVALTEAAHVVVGLAGCGGLAPSRQLVTILPMFIEDVAEAPCTVVAQQA
ncbi:cyclase family protein [Arthrobacter sp. NPDC080031]|uniref:cyclase family protein n=1 Tax=Arthrobacter sp. NPDC080031 TaxID=3155918 RepID=UPI0034505325